MDALQGGHQARLGSGVEMPPAACSDLRPALWASPGKAPAPALGPGHQGRSRAPLREGLLFCAWRDGDERAHGISLHVKCTRVMPLSTTDLLILVFLNKTSSACLDGTRPRTLHPHSPLVLRSSAPSFCYRLSSCSFVFNLKKFLVKYH